MPIPEKLLQCLDHEGVVAITTMGQARPHMVNTWNSYVKVDPAGRLLVPVGYMHQTEANLALDNQILLTLGSREVAGQRGPGTGFLVEGTGRMETSGEAFEAVRARFGWARAARHAAWTT